MFADFFPFTRFPFIGRRASRPTHPTDSCVEQSPRRSFRHLRLVAASFALFLIMLVPTVTVGAQTAYPPNIVISTYYDARYGAVSVVSDASGNLIDVNAATGQRIYPVYADYASGVAYPVPVYTSANSYNYYGASAYSIGNAILRQYTDNNSNCTSGQVTLTASGYYCTATGTPAYRVA